jgi:hypothetical protein
LTALKILLILASRESACHIHSLENISNNALEIEMLVAISLIEIIQIIIVVFALIFTYKKGVAKGIKQGKESARL